MAEYTKKPKKFLSNEYIPLVCIRPIQEEPELIPAGENCNFPNCACEVGLCESMPYVEKMNA